MTRHTYKLDDNRTPMGEGPDVGVGGINQYVVCALLEGNYIAPIIDHPEGGSATWLTYKSRGGAYDALKRVRSAYLDRRDFPDATGLVKSIIVYDKSMGTYFHDSGEVPIEEVDAPPPAPEKSELPSEEVVVTRAQPPDAVWVCPNCGFATDEEAPNDTVCPRCGEDPATDKGDGWLIYTPANPGLEALRSDSRPDGEKKGTSTVIARAASEDGGGVEIKLPDCTTGWLGQGENEERLRQTVNSAFVMQFEAEPDTVKIVEMPYLHYCDGGDED
jgi:hypothetical protein